MIYTKLDRYIHQMISCLESNEVNERFYSLKKDYEACIEGTFPNFSEEKEEYTRFRNILVNASFLPYTSRFSLLIGLKESLEWRKKTGLDK